MNRPSSSSREPHLVLVVSDGTGVTGERVIRAAMTQFDPEAIRVKRISEVRTLERISQAIEEASVTKATVLYSLVSADQRRHLLQEARRHDVSVIDLLGPLLRRFSEVLAVSPRAEAGLFRQLDEEYFRRIEAVDFAVKHDDGARPHELSQADLVLVGVSRSSKTPLSMFLSYRGWHVANVPIVLDLEPPQELFEMDPAKVIALRVQPSWLEGIRRERTLRMARDISMNYAELQHILDEMRWYRHILQRGGWRIVDVTHKAVEETAAEIITIVRG